MFTVNLAPDHVTTTRSLTALECRSWVSGRSEGRLGHHTGRGHRALVVSYAVTDALVVFRVPAYNQVCQYALGRQITLDVGSVDVGSGDAGRTATDVRVSGVGYAPDNPVDLADGVDLPLEWPSGVATRILCLDLAVVAGSTRTREG